MDNAHIITYTGRWINPLEPDPIAISIEDIGHSLSNQCRFTGHVREFYSVAEHSCRVAGLLTTPEEQLQGLLHDASEAYLSDIARPVKQGLGLGEQYREVENNLQATIAYAFGLDWPFADSISWADNVMLRTEQRDLMPEGAGTRDNLPDEYTSPIRDTLKPNAARALFFRAWADLTGETWLAEKYGKYSAGMWEAYRGREV